MGKDAHTPTANSGEGEKVRKDGVRCFLCGAAGVVSVKNAGIEKGRGFRKL